MLKKKSYCNYIKTSLVYFQYITSIFWKPVLKNLCCKKPLPWLQIFILENYMLVFRVIKIELCVHIKLNCAIVLLPYILLLIGKCVERENRHPFIAYNIIANKARISQRHLNHRMCVLCVHQT